MLGGHCHSGSFCNFVESFKHTQQMRHKTPRHPLVDKQVLSKNHWYCLVIPNITFPGKIRFWVNKNILTQISVTSNQCPFRRLFVWNSGSRFASRQWNIWLEINNQLNNCYKGDQYSLIIYQSSTQKTQFEANLFWMELVG